MKGVLLYSFMCVLGSGPALLSGAQTLGNASEKKSRDLCGKNVAHSFLVLRYLCMLGMWIQGSQTHKVKQGAQGITWLNSGILALSLQCEGQRLNQTPSQRTRVLAKRPKWGLDLEFQGGRQGSCVMSRQPVQMCKAFCSEGCRASSLMLCDRHLEIFNNLIFEFVFYKWSWMGQWSMNQGLGASAHKPSCFSPLLAPCFSTASTPSIHWSGPGHEAGRDGARHATHGLPVELWDWDTLVPQVSSSMRECNIKQQV